MPNSYRPRRDKNVLLRRIARCELGIMRVVGEQTMDYELCFNLSGSVSFCGRFGW